MDLAWTLQNLVYAGNALCVEQFVTEDGTLYRDTTVDERNPAPPKKPDDLIPLQISTNNGSIHGFRLVQDFVHPQ